MTCPAFDNGTSTNAWVTGVSSVTLSKTNTGSNIWLGVGIEIYNASALTVSSVVWNTSENASKINSITAALESNTQDAELWGLDAASSGTHNVVVTLSGTASFVWVGATSYTGKTTSGVDANATAQSTVASTSAPVCNVNVVHSDCCLVGLAYSRAAENPSAGTGTVRRVTDGTAQGHAMGDSGGTAVGTGNQTLAWGTIASATWPGMCCCSISAANAGGGGGGAIPILHSRRIARRAA